MLPLHFGRIRTSCPIITVIGQKCQWINIIYSYTFVHYIMSSYSIVFAGLLYTMNHCPTISHIEKIMRKRQTCPRLSIAYGSIGQCLKKSQEHLRILEITEGLPRTLKHSWASSVQKSGSENTAGGSEQGYQRQTDAPGDI